MDDKKPKKKRNQAEGRRARNSRVVDMSMSGMTNIEIAQELGLHRQTVGNILNSQQSKEMIDQARSDLYRALTQSVSTMLDALEFRSADMRTAVQVATTILKGLGVLTEKSEMTVLKPFILKRLDGSEVVMGHTAETKENENG